MFFDGQIGFMGHSLTDCKDIGYKSSMCTNVVCLNFGSIFLFVWAFELAGLIKGGNCLLLSSFYELLRKVNCGNAVVEKKERKIIYLQFDSSYKNRFQRQKTKSSSIWVTLKVMYKIAAFHTCVHVRVLKGWAESVDVGRGLRWEFDRHLESFTTNWHFSSFLSRRSVQRQGRTPGPCPGLNGLWSPQLKLSLSAF